MPYLNPSTCPTSRRCPFCSPTVRQAIRMPKITKIPCCLGGAAGAFAPNLSLGPCVVSVHSGFIHGRPYRGQVSGSNSTGVFAIWGTQQNGLNYSVGDIAPIPNVCTRRHATPGSFFRGNLRQRLRQLLSVVGRGGVARRMFHGQRRGRGSTPGWTSNPLLDGRSGQGSMYYCR